MSVCLHDDGTLVFLVRRTSLRNKCNTTTTGKGKEGEVVGWYVPVVVVEERANQRQVEVMMRMVAVGKVHGRRV